MNRTWLILEIDDYDGSVDMLKTNLQRFLSIHMPQYNPHVDRAPAIVTSLREATTIKSNDYEEVTEVEHKISGEILLPKTGEIFPFQDLRSRYIYRGLPSNVVPDESLWCIHGEDVWDNMSGVLEWCTSEEDAQEILEKMLAFRLQFKNLYASRYTEHVKFLTDLRDLRDANGLDDL